MSRFQATCEEMGAMPFGLRYVPPMVGIAIMIALVLRAFHWMETRGQDDDDRRNG